jgi:cation diffusion facilitator CzcD-associated flavoprotein CzcO
MEKAGFKAIICGAGPVGLVMAHALGKANIDFVVLEEQPVVVRYAGAGLTLSKCLSTVSPFFIAPARQTQPE